MLAEGHRSILWRHLVPTTEPQRFSKLKHGIWHVDRNNHKEISSRPVEKWHQWHCFFVYFQSQLSALCCHDPGSLFCSFHSKLSLLSNKIFFCLILELIATTIKIRYFDRTNYSWGILTWCTHCTAVNLTLIKATPLLNIWGTGIQVKLPPVSTTPAVK